MGEKLDKQEGIGQSIQHGKLGTLRIPEIE